MNLSSQFFDTTQFAPFEKKEFELVSTQAFAKLQYSIWLTAVKDLEKEENWFLWLNLEESLIVPKGSASWNDTFIFGNNDCLCRD